MGRHKKKKVTEKEAEDTLTQQLVESGKKEQLKILVRRDGKKGREAFDSSINSWLRNWRKVDGRTRYRNHCPASFQR